MTGNSSAGQVWDYGYNSRNRMTIVQANGNTVGTYVYNALGQRISKVATLPTAVNERFAYDEQGNLIGEYGTLSRDYIWMSGIPVAVIDTAGSASSTLHYVTADALGTPRAVSDSQGNTIWSWAWLNNPFGEQAPISSNGYTLNLRFPGQYYDAESGLVHNGYRDNCPECGRYIQSDPTGLDGEISTYGCSDLFPACGIIASSPPEAQTDEAAFLRVTEF